MGDISGSMDKFDLDTFKIDPKKIWDQIHHPEHAVRKRFWLQLAEESGAFTEQASADPHFLSDLAEADAKMAEGFCLKLGDYDCEAKTVFELEFLVWLSEGMKRGMAFQQAWLRAFEQIRFLNEVVETVYKLKSCDESEVDIWINRIQHQEVNLQPATVMAKEITATLKQIFLTQEEDFYSGYELNDEDLRDRQILLEKLTAVA
jgi:hypothetical protein